MNQTLELIRNRAACAGLNLVAAVPLERYEAAAGPAARLGAIVPGARSIVVIGNGGGAFWAAFKRHVGERTGWRSEEHPLDDFTRGVVERNISSALLVAGVRHAIVYPFMRVSPALDFVTLGRVAGLCGPGIVGVGLHPVYGPWMAFRAAILVEELIDEPGEALEFDPCPTCPTRSCIDACPAGAVGSPAGWNVRACAAYRVGAESRCAPQCYSRTACVLGPEHRYPGDELAYHQMQALRSMSACRGEAARSRAGEPRG